MNNICKCPNCNRHIENTLDKGEILIYCQCGYRSTMKIKQFIKDSKEDNKSHNKIVDDSFKNITNDLKKCSHHLLTYLNSIKQNHINHLIELINNLESSYEESYERNKNILTFIQILIDNYDGTNEMKNNILDYHIITYQCEQKMNINEVIKYYKEYNCIKKKIHIEEVKTITDHTSCVYSLFNLKDGRVASCSKDTIRIYDPSNDYHCAQAFQRNYEDIGSICQLDDGTIVTSPYDPYYDPKMIDYEIDDDIEIYIDDAYDKYIFRLIPLPDNRIASCSKSNTIKIWKSNPPYSPYSDTPIKVLEGHSDYVISLLYIKERDIMISGSRDKTLRIWNMSTYQCENVIEGVECDKVIQDLKIEYSSCDNSLYQLDNDRVIVGGHDSFYIVNIDKCVIEKTIKDESFGNVYCFIKLRDNKTILCGCDDGTFCYYDMNEEDYTITKNNHKGYISDLLLIDDKTFLSCSRDKTIKVWKYYNSLCKFNCLE